MTPPEVEIPTTRHKVLADFIRQMLGEPDAAQSSNSGSVVVDRAYQSLEHQLVRRLDPAWGASSVVAKLSNDDTFHFTNCSPQHQDFNQHQSLWAGLDDYILDNADNRDFKVSVFSGPLFAVDDDAYRGVNLPRQFWKVVVMVKETGALSVTAYLLSQEALIAGLEVAPEAFSYGAYRTFQVPVRQLEELTRLSFDSLVDADPLGGLEAAFVPRPIQRPQQMVL